MIDMDVLKINQLYRVIQDSIKSMNLPIQKLLHIVHTKEYSNKIIYYYISNNIVIEAGMVELADTLSLSLNVNVT